MNTLLKILVTLAPYIEKLNRKLEHAITVMDNLNDNLSIIIDIFFSPVQFFKNPKYFIDNHKELYNTLRELQRCLSLESNFDLVHLKGLNTEQAAVLEETLLKGFEKINADTKYLLRWDSEIKLENNTYQNPEYNYIELVEGKGNYLIIRKAHGVRIAKQITEARYYLLKELLFAA